MVCGLVITKLWTEQCLLWASFSMIPSPWIPWTVKRSQTLMASPTEMMWPAGCFFGEIDVSAVPLLKTSYPQIESNFKRSDVQFCVKECARGVRDRVLPRATRIYRYFLYSSLFGAIEEIKSSTECHVAFWTLIVILIQSGRTPKTLWKSKTIIWKVQMGVCETKTFESDTRSIIGL